MLVCFMGAVICLLAYKFFPTWMGLLLKMALDNTTGAIDLIKKTYHQVSEYNYKYLCFTFRIMLWSMLGVITFGIGFLWIIPLIAMASVIFFDAIFNPEDYATPDFPDAPAQDTPPAEPADNTPELPEE